MSRVTHFWQLMSIGCLMVCLGQFICDEANSFLPSRVDLGFGTENGQL